MRPIDRIRQDPAEVRRTLELRGFTAPVDRIIESDAKVRALKQESETLKAERNRASKGGPPTPEVREEMRKVGERIRAIDADLAVVQTRIDHDLLWIPNVIDPSVPKGKDEKDNPVISQDPATEVQFAAKPHWDLGEALGILDIPRGTKLSGSRFYVLRGAGAALQRALIAWMIDLKLAHGFVEIYPPFLTKRETLTATGQLPHFDENLYRDTQDDLWLVPTAEPQLVGMHRDETFEATDLPRRYVAYTACFRREHMSAGRDVRGIKRGHQFDKVEMVIHCLPEDSPRELELMRELALDVLRRLRIPARLVERCTGDLGFNALKGYDLEAWAPGQQEWLEVSSISNCGDFQAERSSIRFRREAGAKAELVHTLNASGLALPRLMIAVMESYQQADGSLAIPEVLRPYMGGRERIAMGEFAL
ncbi:MAG: serine--tRNA ligase [Chloroflexi bacterium]|nr:serine--tRNA ligase [Chloroflexota bacterium]